MYSARQFGVLAGLCLGLAGCVGNGPNQDAGALTGAIAGGVAGAALGNGNIGAVAAGAVVGGLIGNEIGAGLDAQDRQTAMAAETRALEYGQAGTPVQWRGRRGYGDVVVGSYYRVNDYNCRDYTHTVYIGGKPAVARGTACKQPDGSWRPAG